MQEERDLFHLEASQAHRAPLVHTLVHAIRKLKQKETCLAAPQLVASAPSTPPYLE